MSPEAESDYVYGHHAVAAALAVSPMRVRRLLALKGRRDARTAEIVEAARAAGLRVENVDRATLDRLAHGVHQGIAAQVAAATLLSEAEFEQRFASWSQPVLLVLDGIGDPRNLGACLRTADGAGVDSVLLTERQSAPLGGVAAKVASGAAESLCIVGVKNLARRLEWLQQQGVWLVGLAGPEEGGLQSLYSVDMTGPTAIVIGSEDKGLRRLTREKCDFLVSIPMAGSVASLNVSVAAGVALYEVVRQRV